MQLLHDTKSCAFNHYTKICVSRDAQILFTEVILEFCQFSVTTVNTALEISEIEKVENHLISLISEI